MDAVLMTEVTNAAAEAAEIASLVRPHFDTPAVGIDRIGQHEIALGRGHLRAERRRLSRSATVVESRVRLTRHWFLGMVQKRFFSGNS